MWEHSDLYSWPYYAFHFSYSFSLLLLSIFIYSSWGLYNLNFKNIILPLYVSISNLYKINRIKEKTQKCVEFHFVYLCLCPTPLRALFFPGPCCTHYTWLCMSSTIDLPSYTTSHRSHLFCFLLLLLLQEIEADIKPFWDIPRIQQSICAIKYCAIGLTRTY